MQISAIWLCLRLCHFKIFWDTWALRLRRFKILTCPLLNSRIPMCLPCGPSMVDYPETYGILKKLIAEVSGRFLGVFLNSFHHITLLFSAKKETMHEMFWARVCNVEGQDSLNQEFLCDYLQWWIIQKPLETSRNWSRRFSGMFLGGFSNSFIRNKLKKYIHSNKKNWDTCWKPLRLVSRGFWTILHRQTTWYFPRFGEFFGITVNFIIQKQLWEKRDTLILMIHLSLSSKSWSFWFSMWNF